MREQKWATCFMVKNHFLGMSRVEQAKYCEYGDFEDQACWDRFIAGLVDEPVQGKLNTNGL